MAIRVNTKDIVIQLDPMDFSFGIEVVEGNTSQAYDKYTNEFNPNRRFIPCILRPYVNVRDPEGVLAEQQELTSCEWYEGSPKNDKSNRIFNGQSYLILTGKDEKYALKVKKNFEVSSPTTLVAVFSINDKRRNKKVYFEASVTFITTMMESYRYSMKLDEDTPPVILVDLARWDGLQKSITAHVYGNGKALTEGFRYWWEIWDKEAKNWRDFTEEEANLMVDIAKYNGGAASETLTVSPEFLTNEVFRCVARPNSEPNVKPVGNDLKLAVTCKVISKIPDKISARINQETAIKLKFAGSSPRQENPELRCEVIDEKGSVLNYNENVFPFIFRWSLVNGTTLNRSPYDRLVRVDKKNFEKNSTGYIPVNLEVGERFVNALKKAEGEGGYITDSEGRIINNIIYE